MNDHEFRKVSVVGLGYIGLPTAAMFASKGIAVVGIDVNRNIIDTINSGSTHIIEPNLDELVRNCVSNGSLTASLVPEPADAFIIAVPTPFMGEKRDPDLRYIKSASINIASVLKVGDIVVLESTVPVGTTEKMSEWLAELRPDLTFPQQRGESSDIRIAHCPERVLPGQVLKELVTNDRIVGGLTERCSDLAVHLYKIFVTGSCVKTTPRAAEITKLTENSFRDVNIAFANELSLICDNLAIDVWEVISLANRHPRVNVLNPGAGVGGHCIAVDPWFLISSSPDNARLIREARAINDGKPDWVIEKVINEAAKLSMPVVTVACLGLAFKPDIDDLRESPALEIYTKLKNTDGLRVLAVEPNIKEIPDISNFAGAELSSIDSALNDADIVVGLVAHKAFREIDQSTLGGKVVIDICALWR